MSSEWQGLEGTPVARPSGELLPRFGARIVDSLLVSVVGMVVWIILSFSAVWLLLQVVLVYAYFVLLDVSYGTTVGKRLFGLRVTGPGGGLPTAGQAAVREAFTLLGVVPYIGSVLALIAWIGIAITINSSPTRQGKHDELAGGTRVVRA